jgi:carbonic anhydrase/acetyltransferase-like protein (isoleucine patch superfamily)
VSSDAREFLVHPDMVGRLRRRGGAMIADNAAVMGDVRLGRDANIWFGVTIRGDDSFIEIGADTNVQDNTCVHVDVGAPQRIGRGVTIGHGVVLHGVEIGDYALLVPENAVIPPRSVVLGVPGKIRRQVTEAEMEENRWRARHYVARAKTYVGPGEA